MVPVLKQEHTQGARQHGAVSKWLVHGIQHEGKVLDCKARACNRARQQSATAENKSKGMGTMARCSAPNQEHVAGHDSKVP